MNYSHAIHLFASDPISCGGCAFLLQAEVASAQDMSASLSFSMLSTG